MAHKHLSFFVVLPVEHDFDFFQCKNSFIGTNTCVSVKNKILTAAWVYLFKVFATRATLDMSFSFTCFNFASIGLSFHFVFLIQVLQ